MPPGCCTVSHLPASGSREKARRKENGGGEARGPGGAPVGLPRRLPGGLLLRGQAARAHHDQAGHHRAPPRQLVIDLLQGDALHYLFVLVCTDRARGYRETEDMLMQVAGKVPHISSLLVSKLPSSL
ncbi:hypothetical protein C2845_PM03G16030 [Panicum miliaceum]|uniref:Uncharacterized protein n=1 Tax=Panicum miliaceum TaxID=4540 RepID=A0A3L6TG25_PANMI|nr:hypothetical protein C2845_PM03G16030 [Panicum miliaceum]